jgi:NAD(P)H-flavin reductase
MQALIFSLISSILVLQFCSLYFFICFYNDVSKYQWHPLSLVSYNEDTLIFCCKNVGEYSWTNRLNNIVENNYDLLSNKTVYIQGPYGNLSSKYNNNIYNNIIIVSGGIGITPMFTIIEDINNMYNQSKLSNLNKVYFIWIINNIELFESFKKFFNNIKHNNIFYIKIFVTRMKNLDYNQNNINIYNYKPNITKILKKFFKKNKNNFLFCCGPTKLNKEITDVCLSNKINYSVEIFE